jgi:hypothetical protein
MTIKILMATIGTIALLSGGVANAQTAKKEQAPRTAKSLECSKQADSKSLHGKPRKKFMSSCKKA